MIACSKPAMNIQEKEIQFHDDWARSVDLPQVAVREAFEAPTALENQFILRSMGPLQGKRVLDVGAGMGESSVYFALLGAEVTCTDLSPGMVDCAVRLGRFHGVK
ncbi:MAG: methyltransferase domain-containing protein, partial [Acidobacteria bacterium]|nr:methyltransferase domain-containing protein [Acidobacteriota bacterium]